MILIIDSYTEVLSILFTTSDVITFTIDLRVSRNYTDIFQLKKLGGELICSIYF